MPSRTPHVLIDQRSPFLRPERTDPLPEPAGRATVATEPAEVGLDPLEWEVQRRVEDRTRELERLNRSLRTELASRVEMLEREHHARLEAEATNRSRDEFLATLSHELRTPLNAILGWIRLLEIDPRDVERAGRAIRAISSNAQAQARLVADILDVSRITGGNLQLCLAPATVGSVVEAALETVQPAAEAKHLRIELALNHVTPILIDSSRLQQVMWNLLSNAIKFTPEGGRIRVAVRGVHGDVVISVTDSGQGIDAAFLPHVFERFTQEDRSMAHEHGGLGLGMAIVRHLVELHGGAVAVSSRGKGQGTTFTVSLPRRRRLRRRRGDHDAARERAT